MTDPVWQALNTARICIERLTHDHATIRSAMAAGTATTTGSSLDPGGTVELTQVEAAALRRIASGAAQYQLLVEHAAHTLLRGQQITAPLITPDTTRLAEQIRCDGGAGEWDDPTCDRTGVKDTWVNGHQHQLCQRCWDRYRQWKRREGVE